MDTAHRTIRHQRIAIFGLLVALTFTLAGFAIASAAVSNTDGTVNACYKNAKGQLRVATTACSTKETAVTLSRATPVWASVRNDGVLLGGKHVTASTQIGANRDLVTFDRNVSACALTATVQGLGAGDAVTAVHGPDIDLGANTAVVDHTGVSFFLVVTC